MTLKIHCECGQKIYDVESGKNKARIIPDEGFFSLLDAIDSAIESSGFNSHEREAACMKVRSLFIQTIRSVWQCSCCSRLYVDMPDHELQSFIPSDKSSASEALASSHKE
jgi:hypothetical protein